LKTHRWALRIRQYIVIYEISFPTKKAGGNTESNGPPIGNRVKSRFMQPRVISGNKQLCKNDEP